MEFYYNESKDIFPNEESSCCCPCWISFLSCLCCKGICSSEYDNQYLSRRLKEIFGTRTLKDSLVPVQVVAFDLNRNAPVYFSSINTTDDLMYDAALATTAAPTFFPAHRFSIGKVDYLCVDGGVFENNLVAAALMIGSRSFRAYKALFKLILIF